MTNVDKFFTLMKGEDVDWVTIELQHPNPSNDDWIGVFSPAKFK